MAAKMSRRVTQFLDWWVTWKVGLVLLILALLSGVYGYNQLHGGPVNVGKLISDFYANVSSELASIAITVLIIDNLNRRREAREAKARAEERAREQEQEQKRSLLRRMASSVNAEAKRACEELRDHGWLTDGTCAEANFTKADLKDAYLSRADLSNTRMYRADLRGANLYKANLSGAKLNGADFRGAQMAFIDLTDANMPGCNLEGVEGLNDASLCLTRGLKGTTMPDGTRYDGRFNLDADIQSAFANMGIDDIQDEEKMAEYYVVPLNVYRAGQRWALEQLEGLRHAAQNDIELGPEQNQWVEVNAQNKGVDSGRIEMSQPGS